MDKSNIILKVENFKFSILDSVPKPDDKIAYILYRDEKTNGNILVITAQKPALSSKIRAGGFNRKMTISLEVIQVALNKWIADISGNYKFSVNLKISYRIKDVAFVFNHNLWNVDVMIENKAQELIECTHKKYDIESQIELENELRKELTNYLAGLTYLEIVSLNVLVELDERAKAIIESKLDTMANSIFLENEGEKASIEVEQKANLEIKKIEAQKVIEEKRGALRKEQAKSINSLREEMGEDVVAFLAYANGEINSIEFDERMQRNRNNNMMTRLSVLKQLADSGILSDHALENAAIKLLGEKDSSGGEMEQKAIPDNNVEQNEVFVEDTEEY